MPMADSNASAPDPTLTGGQVHGEAWGGLQENVANDEEEQRVIYQALDSFS